MTDNLPEEVEESSATLAEQSLAAGLSAQPWEVDGLQHLEAGATSAPEFEPAAPVPTPTSERREPPRETEAPPPLLRIVEALLFVGGPPLTPARACEIIRGLATADFLEAIDELNRSYRAQGRAYMIQLQEHGYILTLRPKFASLRTRMQGTVREARLSQAAVDVLSLVAYRQPITKQELESVRGADSAAVLRQLIRHGLVALKRGDDRELYHVTTTRFLELFRLSSLEDLPQTQDLQRL